MYQKKIKNFFVSSSISKFLITGGSVTLIDYILYMLLSNIIFFTGAKAISMLTASLFSYFLNKIWTFKNTEKSTFKYFFKYYIAFILNIGTNLSINHIVFLKTGQKTIAFIIATFIAMCVNYLLQRFFVFKTEKENNPESKDDF